MQRLLLTLAFFGLTSLTNSLFAGAICPTTTYTTAGKECQFLITIGVGNSLSGAVVSGSTPYDGADDALVGVINNSGAVYTGSISLSTPFGSSLDIFGFDNDGICQSSFSTGNAQLAYCNASQKAGTDPQDYQGPLNTFTVTNPYAGLVNISGLGIGATTFFSLEENLAAFGAPPITVGPSTPEPAAFAMLAGGLGLLALIRRRKLASFL